MANDVNLQYTFKLDAPYTKHVFLIDQSYASIQLSCDFSVHDWMMLLIWDPNNQLRAQYLKVNESAFRIQLSQQPDQCSYSAVPGEIISGEWTIELFSNGGNCNFDLRIEVNNHDSQLQPKQHWMTKQNKEPFFHLNQLNRTKVFNQEARWYKGDFHTHTTISDGKLTPELGMEQARKQGLDFFVATDHNVIPTNWVDSELLVIPGVEITSSKGHFNALGVDQWLDWRPTCQDGGMESEVGMNRLLRETKEANGVRSINHPLLRPWEWQFKQTDLREVDVIEIWNDPTYQDNPLATEHALKLWDELLLDGHKIYGIGGSDSHNLPTESYQEGGPPSLIGDPATYIYAENLSILSVLAGLRRGEAYVARGPELFFDIQDENGPVRLGSTFTGKLTYSFHYKNVPADSKVIWIKNGERVESTNLLTEGLTEKMFEIEKEYAYIRLEVRKENGELVAFTNPIFQGIKTPSIRNWEELLQKAGY
ncbi:hypothetical protein SAMN04487944_11828 [Gracilibacillus ureilyticus]|uniref:Polymerase/histidinol phosphatase N-terminal domain-containing protein n=1 Tax=Gracilibacillus ureilyticus TaxID=531814 RepID=A0A1H9ULC7_9BACI|nr:CehA/McbA family metallohydrolase [Gracilibacillus ureilyticus]SES10098.1 hypothetical protein SAMN04487944_11828 [Gracilibacillus ureilyticus]